MKITRYGTLPMAACLSVATPAAAADNAAADKPVEASEILVLGQQQEGYKTDQITTATRTGTDIRDIPQSIQVVPREVIDDQQLVDLTSVVRNVSGIQPGTVAGNRSENFTIRGFRSSYYAIDSVMLSPAVETNDTFRDLANVERIEVLKGPASVLYGRGDPGGLINIVTKQPQFTRAMQFSAQAGSDRFARGEADVTGPVDAAGTLAFRIVGAAQTSDTFRDVFVPSTRQFVSPSLLWVPDDRTRIIVSGDYTHQQTQSDRGLVAVNGTVDLPRSRYLGEAFATLDSDKKELNYRIERQVSDWLTIRQIGHYDKGGIDLFGFNQRGVTVNARTGQRLSARLATNQTEGNHNYDFQLDAVAKFDTFGIDHTLVIGGEYVKSYRHLLFYRASLASIDIDRPVYGARPGTFALANERTVDAKIWAGYVQDQIDIGSRLKLLAGLRYDKSNQRNQALGQVVTANDDRLSPRIGLVWKPVAPVSLFADYTRSFQPNLGISFAGNPFSPETGEQYEAGVKADLFGERLTITSAVFQLTRDHVITTDPVNLGFSLEAGRQRARGAEIDITGEVLPGLKLIASGAYLKARITNDVTFAIGNTLLNAPKWSGSLWTSYELKAGALRGVGLGAGVFVASNRVGDLVNSFTIGGYVRADASIYYEIDDKLRLTVTGKNLFDRYYIDSSVSVNEVYPAAGRTVLVGLSGKFR